MLTILAVLVGSELAAMGSSDWQVRDRTRPSVLAGLVGSQSADPEVRWRSADSLRRRVRVASPAAKAGHDLSAWGWCDEATARYWAQNEATRKFLADSAVQFGLYNRAVEIAPWEASKDHWWQKGGPVLQVQGFINAARLRSNGVNRF